MSVVGVVAIYHFRREVLLVLEGVLYGRVVVMTVSVAVSLPSVSATLAKTSWPSILPQSCERMMSVKCLAYVKIDAGSDSPSRRSCQ
jgi:hypothetical protein